METANLLAFAKKAENKLFWTHNVQKWSRYEETDYVEQQHKTGGRA